MKKPEKNSPAQFEVKAYRLSLDTAETGTDPRLNRTFSISVFDNEAGPTENGWLGILTFSDVIVQKPSFDKKKTIILHYRRDDFEIVHALLETNFALRRPIKCIYKEDAHGAWGGLQASVISIPKPPVKMKP